MPDSLAPADASVRLEFPELHARLAAHPLYSHIQSEQHLRTFMRNHVFCVWDFQSLLKSLQQALTCVTVPWFPTPDGEARRLVNELVLDEESDEGPDGRYCSHFEMYLAAMQRGGADTGPVDILIEGLAAGESIDRLLERADVPLPIAQFVRGTLQIAQQGSVVARVAAFAYGREDIIPQMFVQLVARLATQQPERWTWFRYYLERHIAFDDERHGPMSRALLARLCGEDQARWDEARRVAEACLEARLAMWDSINREIASA
jgi:Protein of unknown function (DUF3050)